ALVGQVYENNRSSSIAVLLDPEHRRDPESVDSLLMTSPSGLRIPLRQLADIYSVGGRSSISHEGARRRQTLTCTIRGLDAGAFVAQAQKQVAAKVSFPAGT